MTRLKEPYPSANPRDRAAGLHPTPTAAAMDHWPVGKCVVQRPPSPRVGKGPGMKTPPDTGNVTAPHARGSTFHPKPKPRWDVHLLGTGNRGGNLEGVFRPLIAGPSGSAVSHRLSGWTARPGSCSPAPAPPPCCPGTDFQWPPPPPSPRLASSALKSGLYESPKPDRQPCRQAGKSRTQSRPGPSESRIIAGQSVPIPPRGMS